MNLNLLCKIILSDQHTGPRSPLEMNEINWFDINDSYAAYAEPSATYSKVSDTLHKEMMATGHRAT